VFIILLYIAGQPEVHRLFGAQTSAVVTTLSSDKLNTRDGVRLERSYYESLMRVDRFHSRLWEVYKKNPLETNEWGEVGRTIQFTNDLRFKELRSDLHTSLKNRTFSTNRWGLRDRDYEKAKPADTVRAALLGASIEVGSGVGDVENFESLLEERLNGGEDGPVHRSRYEILNFAVGGYGPIENFVVLEKKALEFQPDILLYVGHDSDEERAVGLLAKAVFRGAAIPYAGLKHVAAAAEGAPSESAAETRLKPFGREIVAWAYREVADICRANGIRPVWMFVPAVHVERNKIAYLGDVAREAGFEVFDLSDVFAGQDLTRLRISDLDSHPNPEGHRVLANRIYADLHESVFQATAAKEMPASNPSQR